MEKLKRHSTLPILFVTALIIVFCAGQSATAQDGSAAEIDQLSLLAEIELITPLGTEVVQLSGPVTQHVYFEGSNHGDAQDDDGDGLDEVTTEIVSMNLQGSSPSMGQVNLRVVPDMPSLGQIIEQVNNTPGVLDLPPFGSGGTADSFFDVFVEVEVPGMDQTFVTLVPKRLIGVITHKPAAPCDSYENEDETQIYDSDGNPTGFFIGPMRLQGICDDECDWNPDDAHKMHWPQLPDLGASGIDVDMSTLFFADDFRCTATGSVDDIHFWGSFRDDVLPPNGPDSLIFEIAIYADIPATENSWSMPGGVLWSKTFGPGEYSVRKLDDSPEGWYDPAKELYLPNNHMQAYQYNFCIKEGAFIQQEGTIYWLSVKELRPEDADYRFGWKTTTHKLRWNDAAVFFFTEKLVSFPMKYPKDHEYMGESLDLAFVITKDEEGPGEHDLGDAPDSSNSFPGQSMLAYPSGVIGNYPTVYEIGSPPYGPIHWLPHAKFYLGQTVTNEMEADIGYDEDIKNNLVPADDLSDLDGGDDGVRLTLVLPDCQLTTFDYTVTGLAADSATAYVNVWFDWNRDGDWDDTMECPDGTTVPEWAVPNHQILVNPGTYTLTTPRFICWHPQTDAELDPVWMRITIGEIPLLRLVDAPALTGGAGPAGGYDYGETEDYLIYPRREGEPLKYDWGDAPTGTVAAGYPTLSFNSGANHAIAGPWLGDENDRPESEPDGQPDTNALGDDNDVNDDENGVSFPTLIPGQPVNLTVEVNGGGGIVQGWIDFNGDMTWDASEKIYDGFLPAGSHAISISVPISTLSGQTFARFRISKQGGLSPKGPSPDGEVEDHEVFVESQPQVTTRSVSATQCPVAQTQCPATATVCPASDTQCPPVKTRCPAAATTCPAVQTQCPAAATSCPAVQTQCPAAATTCPPVQTQCPAAATTCPPVQTRCPAVETECPPEPTKCEILPTQCPAETRCPALETQCPVAETLCPPLETRCPAVETECPPSETRCPPVPTKCPPVPTRCPAGDTQCPISETRCPPEPTKCPPVPTQCPAVETECPPSETRCPPMETECPASETRCPPSRTTCPPVPTQCPDDPTRCPPSDTQCPAVETECPPSETRCPPVPTKCPPVPTRCPGGDTQCPVSETRCPPEPTKCPPVPTQCPVVETECPPTETKCPPMETECPASETRCPPSRTTCPPVPTQCPDDPTRCPPSDTQCPAVETECPPTETKCPAVETECPPSETRCPPSRTTCPPVPTQCPDDPTRCPPSDTQCPAVDTECPPSDTRCPGATTSCPVVITRCPTTSTKCPVVETQCPAMNTACPPQQTQCPTANTQCPPSKTQCPTLDTQCPTSDTRCPVSKTICPFSETNCPTVETKCPPTETQCNQVDTKCPPDVPTKCPVVPTECPPEPTWCPKEDTMCPSLRTHCPTVSTLCPPSDTQCPVVETECPVDPTRACQRVLGSPGLIEGTRNFLITAQCPAIDAQCPTVVPKLLLAKAP